MVQALACVPYCGAGFSLPSVGLTSPICGATFYESFLLILATPLTPHRGQRRYSSVSSGGENNSTAGGPGRFNLAERGLAAI